MTRKPVPGLVWLMAGSAVDATSGVLTRLTASDGFTTASARGFLAFLVLFAVLAVRDKGRVWPSIRSLGWWGLLFAAMNSGGMVLNVLSLKLTAVANFFMIFATAPFVAALLGWMFLREKPDLATLLAALAGFAGIAVMVSGGLAGVNLGDVLAIVVVFSYALNVLIVRKAPKIDVLPLICVTVLASGVIAWPFAHFGGLQPKDWGALVALGFVQLGLGNVLIFTAVSKVTAAQAGLLGIMGAVFAPIWVFAVLGEVPPARTLLGGAVILSAAAAHFVWTLTRPAAAGVQPVAE